MASVWSSSMWHVNIEQTDRQLTKTAKRMNDLTYPLYSGTNIWHIYINVLCTMIIMIIIIKRSNEIEATQQRNEHTFISMQCTSNTHIVVFNNDISGQAATANSRTRHPNLITICTMDVVIRTFSLEHGRVWPACQIQWCGFSIYTYEYVYIYLAWKKKFEMNAWHPVFRYNESKWPCEQWKKSGKKHISSANVLFIYR